MTEITLTTPDKSGLELQIECEKALVLALTKAAIRNDSEGAEKLANALRAVRTIA